MEKLQHSHLEVKSDSLISYDFHDDEFSTFEKHTTRIGSKLMKEMGYQGKDLGIKGQGIINPEKGPFREYTNTRDNTDNLKKPDFKLYEIGFTNPSGQALSWHITIA